MTQVKIKRLSKGARLPERKTDGAAGYDTPPNYLYDKRAISLEKQEYIYQHMSEHDYHRTSKEIGVSYDCVRRYVKRFGGILKEHGFSVTLKCPICGKEFRIKHYHTKRCKRICCSRECASKYRSEWFKGENNHQYGLKGDKNSSFKKRDTFKKNHKLNEDFVYVDANYPGSQENGRVRKHRLIVEQYHELFNPNYFEHIGKYYVLKKGIDVHHIDGNHDNNELSNLAPMPRSEHTRLHNKNRIMIRNEKGQWVKRL